MSKIPNIYFVTTLNCTHACNHCYLSAGPGKKDSTVSFDDFVKAINNFPKKKLDLEISGGEVFSIKNEFYSFLDYLKQENMKREKEGSGKIGVIVQTNGFWAGSRGHIKRTLEELADFGVQGIDITSRDKYHADAGINQDNIKLLKNMADSMVADEDASDLPFQWVTLRGAGKKSRPFPLGRAEDFSPRQSYMQYGDKAGTHCFHFMREQNVSIRENGEVYACCFSLFKLPGNIFEDSLEAIFSRASKDTKFQALDAKGIKGLALLDGYSAKQINSSIKRLGKCGFCYSEYVRTGKAV